MGPAFNRSSEDLNCFVVRPYSIFFPNAELASSTASPAVMKKKKISQSRMAVPLKTSRTQVDRLLDPANDITLASLQRSAAIVGCKVMIELV